MTEFHFPETIEGPCYTLVENANFQPSTNRTMNMNMHDEEKKCTRCQDIYMTSLNKCYFYTISLSK